MSKKYNTMLEEEVTPKPISRDEIFRSLGYRIYSRPNAIQAIWIKDDILYRQVKDKLYPVSK